MHTPASVSIGGDSTFFDLLLESARSGVRATVPEAQRDGFSHKSKGCKPMRDEAASKRATILLMVMIGAWSREPQSCTTRYRPHSGVCDRQRFSSYLVAAMVFGYLCSIFRVARTVN